MAKKKPEQRSTQTEIESDEPVAPQPTGDEVYTSTDQFTETNPDAENEPADERTQFEQGMDNVRLVATRYYEKLTETADQMTQQVRNAYKTSQTYVGDHPGISLSSAFLIGITVGVVLFRR